MAGAALAILGPLIGKELVPVLGKSIVRLMDKIHGRGNPELNPKKKFDGVALFQRLLQGLEKELPGLGLPEGEELGTLIEMFHSELKGAGALKGRDTIVDLPEPASPKLTTQEPPTLVAATTPGLLQASQQRAKGLANQLRDVADQLDGLEGEYRKDLAAVERVQAMLNKRSGMVG